MKPSMRRIVHGHEVETAMLLLDSADNALQRVDVDLGLVEATSGCLPGDSIGLRLQSET